MRRTIILAAALLAAVPAVAAVPPRQQAVTDTVIRGPDDTEAQRIFTSLMSPFCPGLTVAACPSPGAEEIRQEVRSRLARGESRAAIVDALVAVYGEQLLGAPPAKRWGLALWIPPALLLLAGGSVLSWWLRRRGTRPEDPVVAATPTREADRARLAAALRDFDRDA